MSMMKLVYRVTVIILILSLVIILSMVENPFFLQNLFHGYHESPSQEKDKKYDSLLTVRHLGGDIAERNRKINEEWEDFLRLGRKASSKRKFKKFSLNFRESVDRNTSQTEQEYENGNRKKKKKSFIILLYTGLHKSIEWYNLPITATRDFLKRTKCKYHNCRVTYDRGLLQQADVVIFHERNLPSDSVLRSISSPYYRPPSQRWVHFTSETPKNSEIGPVPYNDLFNWTMSYKVDSDIFLPYLQYRKLGEHEKRPSPDINYATNKSRVAAWLVGNCKFAFRIDFAHLLSQHTDVYVGGGCRDKFEKKINCTRWCDFPALQDYKFYLSFENGICTDYVSEKYWRYLEMGLVPVVLGGANYSDPRVAIPGSFIDASRFNSIKELGQYLNYLHKNDSAYNEYFKWKQKYKIWHPPFGDWPFESYFLCKICELLHKDPPYKVYDHLSDYWNEYTDCELPETKLREKFIPHDFSWETREIDVEEERRVNNAKISKDFDED